MDRTQGAYHLVVTMLTAQRSVLFRRWPPLSAAPTDVECLPIATTPAAPPPWDGAATVAVACNGVVADAVEGPGILAAAAHDLPGNEGDGTRTLAAAAVRTVTPLGDGAASSDDFDFGVVPDTVCSLSRRMLESWMAREHCTWGARHCR